jgi:hypothetical protein
MMRMIDDRTLLEILFSRRQAVENYPRLCGQQAIGYPARRNNGRARLSAMLCKGVVVALKGEVRAIEALAGESGTLVRSLSQTGGFIHTSVRREGEAWLPFGKPTYHLALLALAEALLEPELAGDLLDALEEVLEHRQAFSAEDERDAELIAHLIGLTRWVNSTGVNNHIAES